MSPGSGAEAHLDDATLALTAVDEEPSPLAEEHLARCEGCREHLAEHRELLSWARHLPEPDPVASIPWLLRRGPGWPESFRVVFPPATTSTSASVPTVDVAALGARHPGLSLLVLIGSRATGAAHEASDWDLGLLADPATDLLRLRADVVDALGTDRVDLVDMGSASAVLRRDAAAQGQVLLEREPGTFVDFQIEASLFWCDVEPVVREAHADVLRHLRAQVV